jgi:pimeloyl-ACP methyl ester carboxylesterase
MTAAAGDTEGLLDGTRFRLCGEGPSVVLIHGVGMDLEMWEAVVGRMRQGRRVLSYDMLGHGGSAKPPGPYRLADFVAQLAALIRSLRLARFDLVGFSMGAMVAQAFAVANPQAVGRLVLLNGVYSRSPSESTAVRARVNEVLNGDYVASIAAALERWFSPEFRKTRPDVVAAVRRRMESNDLAAYAAAYAVFASADRELVDIVHRIGTATLVATGAEDQRSTPAMAHALSARLPRGQVQIMDGQRHLTPLEAPERVASLIEEFLAGIAGKAEEVVQA